MAKIDFTYLEVLCEDDDDFKKEYLETFESNYTSLTEKMQKELSGGDFVSLGKTAHQLKPTAKMIQLPCAEDLEHLQHHPQDATKDKIAAIRKECEEAFKALKKWAES
ncbi:MAG: hypothetical protein Tsb0034_08030 [Ekhidna sp.]